MHYCILSGRATCPWKRKRSSTVICLCNRTAWNMYSNQPLWNGRMTRKEEGTVVAILMFPTFYNSLVHTIQCCQCISSAANPQTTKFKDQAIYCRLVRQIGFKCSVNTLFRTLPAFASRSTCRRIDEYCLSMPTQKDLRLNILKVEKIWRGSTWFDFLKMFWICCGLESQGWKTKLAMWLSISTWENCFWNILRFNDLYSLLSLIVSYCVRIVPTSGIGTISLEAIEPEAFRISIAARCWKLPHNVKCINFNNRKIGFKWSLKRWYW